MSRRAVLLFILMSRRAVLLFNSTQGIHEVPWFPASKGYYQIRLQAKKNTTAATHTYSGRLPKVVSTVCVAALKLGFALNLVVMKAVGNHPL